MPKFDIGDTIVIEKSASIPTATVKDYYHNDDGVMVYKLEWSNGTVNEKRCRYMELLAINK